jgi:2,4-dienoyl-CoA reductase-like NADH-dependent reductase (Old Yellow Enzyme family)
MVTYPKLAEPFHIGKKQMKNRIVFAPANMGHGGPNGEVTDQTLCHYVARAQGGVGLIVVEHALVTYDYSKGALGMYNDLCMRGWWEISHAIRQYGVGAVVQLGLGHGPQTSRARRPDVEIVAPSEVAIRIPEGSACTGFKDWEGLAWEPPRALAVSEIVKLEESFVVAAQRVQRAGFDGVEIHGAHGYLTNSFLSPHANRRSDEYGGSFEKRLTLAKNVVRKTRAALGADFIIGIRLSAQEHIDGGYGLEEGCRIAEALEAAGLDYIHASSGGLRSMKNMLPGEDGAILPEAAALKKAVTIPVICPNIHAPATGERALREGLVDAVSPCRGLIADPEWPNKALSGREEEISACIRCNNCLKTMWTGYGARCTVNPDVGRERFIARYAPPPLGIR